MVRIVNQATFLLESSGELFKLPGVSYIRQQDWVFFTILHQTPPNTLTVMATELVLSSQFWLPMFIVLRVFDRMPFCQDIYYSKLGEEQKKELRVLVSFFLGQISIGRLDCLCFISSAQGCLLWPRIVRDAAIAANIIAIYYLLQICPLQGDMSYV